MLSYGKHAVCSGRWISQPNDESIGCVLGTCVETGYARQSPCGNREFRAKMPYNPHNQTGHRGVSFNHPLLKRSSSYAVNGMSRARVGRPSAVSDRDSLARVGDCHGSRRIAALTSPIAASFLRLPAPRYPDCVRNCGRIVSDLVREVVDGLLERHDVVLGNPVPLSRNLEPLAVDVRNRVNLTKDGNARHLSEGL